jgi:hypothetical protein
MGFPFSAQSCSFDPTDRHRALPRLAIEAEVQEGRGARDGGARGTDEEARGARARIEEESRTGSSAGFREVWGEGGGLRTT